MQNISVYPGNNQPLVNNVIPANRLKRRSEEIEAAEVGNDPKRQKAESHGRAVVEVENDRKHEKAECHGRAVVADSHKRQREKCLGEEDGLNEGSKKRKISRDETQLPIVPNQNLPQPLAAQELVGSPVVAPAAEPKLEDLVLKEDPSQRFVFKSEIGKGGFGSVHLATDKEKQLDVAIKVQMITADNKLDLAWELHFLLNSNKECNVVQCLGSYIVQSELWIVMELMSGSLATLIEKEGKYWTEFDIANYARQVLSGLEAFHSQNRIHRDIKAVNILVKEYEISGNTFVIPDWELKLGDLGLAEQLTSEKPFMTARAGTTLWRAPEVTARKPYDQKADIFSFGVLCLEMCGARKFINYLDYVEDIVPVGWSRSFYDFVCHCLDPNPADRWSASQLLKHEFLQNLITSNSRPKTTIREGLSRRNAIPFVFSPPQHILRWFELNSPLKRKQDNRDDRDENSPPAKRHCFRQEYGTH